MSMRIENIVNRWDVVQGQRRNIEYRTLEDPVTHKKVIEVEVHLYDEKGRVHPVDKGRTIDIKA